MWGAVVGKDAVTGDALPLRPKNVFRCGCFVVPPLLPVKTKRPPLMSAGLSNSSGLIFAVMTPNCFFPIFINLCHELRSDGTFLPQDAYYLVNPSSKMQVMGAVYER